MWHPNPVPGYHHRSAAFHAMVRSLENLPDPAKFTGSAAERATLLNELYAGLRRRLEAFTALPMSALDGMALKARIDELADPHVRTR